MKLKLAVLLLIFTSAFAHSETLTYVNHNGNTVVLDVHNRELSGDIAMLLDEYKMIQAENEVLKDSITDKQNIIRTLMLQLEREYQRKTVRPFIYGSAGAEINFSEEVNPSFGTTFGVALQDHLILSMYGGFPYRFELGVGWIF